MKLKKPIKILIITVLAIAVVYAVFILLLLYTPLWTFMPENIQQEVLRFKMEKEGGFLGKVFFLWGGQKSLVDVIQDRNEDPGARMEAISAVSLRAHYGNKGLSVEEIEAFYQVVKDPGNSIHLRKEALNTLRIEGVTDEKIVDLEMEIAGDPTADSDLKFIAIKALGEAGVPRAVDVLMEALEDSDGMVSGMAGMALAKTGSEDIIPKLLEIVTDKTERPLTRESAMIAIEDMIIYHEIKLSKETINTLMSLLKNEHFRIRAAAASLLNTITGEEYEIEGPTEEESQTYFLGE